MSELATALLAQGPIGIVCLLLIWAVIHLYAGLQASHNARLEEAKEMIKAIHESTRGMNELSRLLQNAITMLKP